MTSFKIKENWNKKAEEWNDWIGENGDRNRRFNSDPILWEFLGDVSGKKVLDAGCGTGYLSLKLNSKGASVIGIDISTKMISIAKKNAKRKQIPLDFRVDSCESLTTISDNSIDVYISNYVLMDFPNLENAISAMSNKLKNNGMGILIFGHPCFDICNGIEYPYFIERECEEKWGPFKTSFTYFHRPFSTYWKLLQKYNLKVEDFDEPLVSKPLPDDVDEKEYEKYLKIAYSIALKIVKKHPTN